LEALFGFRDMRNVVVVTFKVKPDVVMQLIVIVTSDQAA